jgi:plastocyanin
MVKKLIGVDDYLVASMVGPGKIAFPVILVLGAITGYLTYDSFHKAMPVEGVVDSPYWKPLSESSSNQTNTGGNKTVDESKFSTVVAIKILKGSSVQGNPDFDPDGATAGSDALVSWENTDTTLHTATSGTGSSDPDSGKLFDSGFLNSGQKYSVPAADIGAGEHPYYCQVHPYMTSKITVQ